MIQTNSERYLQTLDHCSLSGDIYLISWVSDLTQDPCQQCSIANQNVENYVLQDKLNNCNNIGSMNTCIPCLPPCRGGVRLSGKARTAGKIT